MLEVASRVRKKKSNLFNKYFILSVLCVALLSVYPYGKTKASEYNVKNEDVKKQIESLSKENNELKQINNTLNKSKTDLENKINSLPKASN